MLQRKAVHGKGLVRAVDLSLGSFWKWGLDPTCGQATLWGEVPGF